MVEIAESYPSVSIVSSYGLAGKKVVGDKLPFPSHFIPGHDICRNTLLDIVYPFWSPSSLLIRSDIMRRRMPFYNEAHLHADTEAWYEILQHSDFGFVHQVLTFLRTHDESITSTVAEPFNKLKLYSLDLLIRYGPIYLDAREYRSHLRLKFLNYYRFLSHSLFRLRGREFWKYHYRALKEMGCSLSVAKLVFVAIGELIRMPVAMFKLIFRSLAKSKK